MANGPTLPPQAYTREILTSAFNWLQSQPESVKKLATTPDALVGLYMRAQRFGASSLEADAPVSSQNFMSDLKHLAEGLKQFEGPRDRRLFETASTGPIVTAQQTAPPAPPQAAPSTATHANPAVAAAMSAAMQAAMNSGMQGGTTTGVGFAAAANQTTSQQTYNQSVSQAAHQASQTVHQSVHQAVQQAHMAATQTATTPPMGHPMASYFHQSGSAVPSTIQTTAVATAAAGSMAHLSGALNERSIQMIQEVKHALNLTTDAEVINMMVSIAYKNLKDLLV